VDVKIAVFDGVGFGMEFEAREGSTGRRSPASSISHSLARPTGGPS
jgi:hypothetical protein